MRIKEKWCVCASLQWDIPRVLTQRLPRGLAFYERPRLHGPVVSNRMGASSQAMLCPPHTPVDVGCLGRPRWLSLTLLLPKTTLVLPLTSFICPSLRTATSATRKARTCPLPLGTPVPFPRHGEKPRPSPSNPASHCHRCRARSCHPSSPRRRFPHSRQRRDG